MSSGYKKNLVKLNEITLFSQIQANYSHYQDHVIDHKLRQHPTKYTLQKTIPETNHIKAAT